MVNNTFIKLSFLVTNDKHPCVIHHKIPHL